MRKVLIRVAHVVHHFHVAVEPHVLQRLHGIWHGQFGAQPDELILRYGNGGAVRLVRPVIKNGNNHVQAVVAAFESDEH